jgi:hypothetical protein
LQILIELPEATHLHFETSVSAIFIFDAFRFNE